MTAATSGLKTPSPRCTRCYGSAAVAGSSRRGCRPDCRRHSPPARGRSSAAPETKSHTHEFTSTVTWKQSPTTATEHLYSSQKSAGRSTDSIICNPSVKYAGYRWRYKMCPGCPMSPSSFSYGVITHYYWL